jgi:hypothetical protein
MFTMWKREVHPQDELSLPCAVQFTVGASRCSLGW